MKISGPNMPLLPLPLQDHQQKKEWNKSAPERLYFSDLSPSHDPFQFSASPFSHKTHIWFQTHWPLAWKDQFLTLTP